MVRRHPLEMTFTRLSVSDDRTINHRRRVEWEPV
jgi:hypothetical protein